MTTLNGNHVQMVIMILMPIRKSLQVNVHRLPGGLDVYINMLEESGVATVADLLYTLLSQWRGTMLRGP